MGRTETKGRYNGLRIRARRAMPADDGMTLIEVVIAMMVLVVGMLGMAHAFYMGVTVVSGSSGGVIAREKAREAIESVHAARDSGRVNWSQVRNANPPTNCPVGTTPMGSGIFRNGMRDVGAPGPDGLVNTLDDAGVEIAPGKDNLIGTDDDINLSGFERQISICDIPANPNLRMIIVQIRYTSAKPQDYVLRSYVSRFS